MEEKLASVPSLHPGRGKGPDLPHLLDSPRSLLNHGELSLHSSSQDKVDMWPQRYTVLPWLPKGQALRDGPKTSIQCPTLVSPTSHLCEHQGPGLR